MFTVVYKNQFGFVRTAQFSGKDAATLKATLERDYPQYTIISVK